MNYSPHNQQLLDTATQVQEVLSRHGLSSGIAGGFARDAFYGLDAKDIDVWVYGMPLCDRGKANDAIAELNSVFECDLFGSSADGLDFFCSYCNVKIPSHNIDIIFCKELEGEMYNDIPLHPLMSLRSVVDRFDYNINQFIISDGQPLFIGDKHHPVSCGLVNLRDDTPPERIEKMQKRWARILEAGA